MDPHGIVVRVAVAATAQAVMVVVLRWLQRPRPEIGPTGRLEYGRRVKAFSIAAFVGLPVCVALVGALASPRTTGGIAGWLVAFIAAVAITAFLVVRIHTATTFDSEGLCVLSPLRKARALRWCDVRVIRWATTGLLVVSDGGRTVVHIAPGLAGTRALASECVSRVLPEIVERDPDAQAALDLMLAGLAHTLVVPRVRPSIIRAAVGR
jgi:hypothetical protein